MKNFLLFSLLTFTLPLIMSAQDGPVRMQRKTTITLEGGWNSLAGTGINVSYFPISKLAIDIGAGLGLQLFKGGLRSRYFFLDSDFSPYLGIGYIIAPNKLEGVSTTDNNGNVYEVNLLPSHYGQFVMGIEYMSHGGFVIGANLGFVLRLKDNIEVAQNSTTNDPLDSAFNLIYGNGIALGLNIGYSF